MQCQQMYLPFLITQIHKIERFLTDSITQREILFEEKRKQAKLFEQKIAEKFDIEANDRKEQEKRLMGIIDDKSNSIRTELGKEAAIREEGVESLKSCMEVLNVCLIHILE